MKQQLKYLFTSIAIVVGLAFTLFMINQINGVYLLANNVHPVLGQTALWFLILLSIVVISIPFVIYFKMPKALDPSEAQTDLVSYQEKLIKRLSKNKVLKAENCTPLSIDDLPKSIELLDKKADEEIKQIAATVFLTTAISQNGKLDALTVLATQSKMVWRIAHIYYQRPTLKDLFRLYSNVALSTFLASEIEDLDISEQFQPVIHAMMKNTAGKSLPIVGTTANIVMDSLLEGTTNAFLSLRVGIISKNYCGSISGFDGKKAKRNAYIEASEMLGKIVVQSSGKVISSVLKATKNAGVETLKSGLETVKNAGEKVKNSVLNVGKNLISKPEKTIEN